MAKDIWEYIPSFDRLYDKVCKFVKKNQGRKGYIATQDKYGEDIRCLCYNDEEGINMEYRVHGVRFKNDKLQIVYAPIITTTRIEFNDKYFKDESKWLDINHENVCYYYTLIEIASHIDAYAMAKDKKGNEICVGDKVIWYDPDKSARDTSIEWEVFSVNPEMVRISCDYGEAEVLPEELKVITK
jgi:hypothetical protein